MKAGWKTRIDERRYFEQKRKEWLVRVLDTKMHNAQIKFQEEEAKQHLKLLTQPINSLFKKI